MNSSSSFPPHSRLVNPPGGKFPAMIFACYLVADWPPFPLSFYALHGRFTGPENDWAKLIAFAPPALAGRAIAARLERLGLLRRRDVHRSGSGSAWRSGIGLEMKEEKRFVDVQRAVRGRRQGRRQQPGDQSGLNFARHGAALRRCGCQHSRKALGHSLRRSVATQI